MLMWKPPDVGAENELSAAAEAEKASASQPSGKQPARASRFSIFGSLLGPRSLNASFHKRAHGARSTFSFKKKLHNGSFLLRQGKKKSGKGGKSGMHGGVLGAAAATEGGGGGKREGAAPRRSKSGGARGSGPAAPVLLSVAELGKIKASALRSVAAIEATVGGHVTLPARLGEVLDRIKVDVLVREWDVMGSGEVCPPAPARAHAGVHVPTSTYTCAARAPCAYNTPMRTSRQDTQLAHAPAQITRLEFRKGVRDPKLGLPADVLGLASIDSLFDSIDADSSGALDTDEMRQALKTFQREAAAARSRDDAERARAERHRQRAAQADGARDATEVYETAEARLHQVRLLVGKEPAHEDDDGSSALNAQVHVAMAKRNLKPETLVASWDPQQSGRISLGSFRRRVRAMVPAADSDAIDEIFRQWGRKKEGVVTNADTTAKVEDLREALRLLQVKVRDAQDEEVGLARVFKEARQTAADAQRMLVEALQADELEEEERTRAEAQASAEAERAKTEAAEKARQLRAAKVAAKAAEKAAFDARVAAKQRKGHAPDAASSSSNAEQLW